MSTNSVGLTKLDTKHLINSTTFHEYCQRLRKFFTRCDTLRLVLSQHSRLLGRFQLSRHHFDGL